MSARILDGAACAREMGESTREAMRPLSERGIRPGLGVLLVGDDPASAIYVRNKTRACDELGILHETIRLSAEATTEGCCRAVEAFNARTDIHGILVQLPLPSGVDADVVLRTVDPSKDVDGFHPTNAGLLLQNRARFVPCTPLGILELLRRQSVALDGCRAVVLGRSNIVGKPMALLLLHANATVTLAHSRTRNLAEVTREADLLVVAAGRPGLVDAQHVKPGAVVIDVGMNRITDEKLAQDLLEPARFAQFQKKGFALVGDVNAPSVREVASALTPVPGGVGPLTIAALLSNTVKGASQ